MAVTGTWKDRQSIEAGARKWGTGSNPVHSVRDGSGRDIAPETADGVIPDELQAHGAWHFDNDPVVPIPFPSDTGAQDHPDWQDEGFRRSSGDWPEWGNYVGGLPGGAHVRSEVHGMGDQQTPNQVPTETWGEGWENKQHGTVSDSRVSDAAQLIINTSGVQRDAVRSGSQRGRGSASEYAAPVSSRIVGKKVKRYSGGQRHYDMFPRQQYDWIRAWWSRAAGTGNPALMEANAFEPVAARTRQVPADPNPGPLVIADNYGYTGEDVLPYV